MEERMQEMSRYIDADKLIEAIEDSIGYINFSSPYQDDVDAIVEGMERIKSIVDDTPTVDAVPKGLFDQIKWERDIAIGQLQEIGCELGRDMNDVVQVVRCKDCKYWICEEQTINGEKVVRCAVDDERWTGGNDFCSFGTKFVHGHWVEDPENETVVCSNCGQEFDLKYKNDVCLNCYAKMDGKDETESAICGTTGLECIWCNPSGCDHRMEKQSKHGTGE